MAKNKKYVVVRARLAGVMCGYLESMTKTEIVLTEARQIWKFVGAETCTGLAEHGCGSGSKIDKPASRVTIDREPGIVVLECTKAAQAALQAVRW